MKIRVLKSGLSERVVAGFASHNTLTQTTFEYPWRWIRFFNHAE